MLSLLYMVKQEHVLSCGFPFADLHVALSTAMQDGDGWDVQRLKGELQALLLAMHDRMQSMETVQEQQNAAIQVSHMGRTPFLPVLSYLLNSVYFSACTPLSDAVDVV